MSVARELRRLGFRTKSRRHARNERRAFWTMFLVGITFGLWH